MIEVSDCPELNAGLGIFNSSVSDVLCKHAAKSSKLGSSGLADRIPKKHLPQQHARVNDISNHH